MACNTCSKSFSLLRPEKGCPGCGFSYCSKCLNHKIFLHKINSESKVCSKCSQTANSNEPTKIVPPDAYYKRIGVVDTTINKDLNFMNSSEREIYNRLQKLKEDKQIEKNHDITTRLKNLKGEVPSTSDAELTAKLANLKGVPISAVQSKAILPTPDLRSEQEQADDLMKQYMEKANIDTKYKDEFEGLVSDIENRLQKLKSTSAGEQEKVTTASDTDDQSDNEENLLQKIIEEAKAKVKFEESEICDTVVDELPFCEICNEDAKMRCLGCKYLFCKICFNEHKDDDGCDRYEPYSAPKN
ncbi:unnamed protein product, partial [Brenthis ino]